MRLRALWDRWRVSPLPQAWVDAVQEILKNPK